MKKLMVLIAMVLGLAGTAGATVYEFSGYAGADPPGPIMASATMDVNITLDSTEYLVTVLLRNTSPYPTYPISGLNSPAITGFGISFGEEDSPALPIVEGSLSLTAYSDPGNTTVVDLLALEKGWKMYTTKSGVAMDYLPSTSNGVNYALYNPAALDGFGDDPLFTEALLSFRVASNPGMLAEEYVRFQNVGVDGSTKLWGGQNPVPEPGTMMLLGAGFLGLALYAKRRKNA